MNPNETKDVNLHYVGDNHDFEDWAREVVYKTNTLVTQKIQNTEIQRFDFFFRYIYSEENDEVQFEPYYVFCFEYKGMEVIPSNKGFSISDSSLKPFFNGYFFNKGYTKSASVNRAAFYCFNCISDWFKGHYGE